MDRRRSPLENALQPLVSGLVEVAPTVWKHSKRIGKYWLMLPFDCSKILFDIATGRYEYVIEENELSLKEQLEINNVVKYKYFPLDDLEREFINPKFIRYEYIEGDKEGVKGCIGCDLEGNPQWFNILNGHTLVGGASRWGKSSFLNTFITYILMTYTENEVAFMGSDFKASDVYYFRRFRHFRGEVATSETEFMQHMNKLEAEIDRRKAILGDKYRNVINYNKKNEEKLSYIIYVVDELPLLTSNKKCADKLRLIMGQCASYGIYFILATQDSTKESIGKCKMNCSQVVGFHTKDETDSKTLINSDILKDITVRGRCFIDNGAETTETQIFYLEEDEIEELLQDKLKEKYKPVEVE